MIEITPRPKVRIVNLHFYFLVYLIDGPKSLLDIRDYLISLDYVRRSVYYSCIVLKYHNYIEVDSEILHPTRPERECIRVYKLSEKGTKTIESFKKLLR